MSSKLARNLSFAAAVLLMAAAFGLALRYGDPVSPAEKPVAHDAGARHG
jgi:hypothetical protein